MSTDVLCSKCGGVGWIIVERANVSGAEPCECRSQGRAERMEGRAQIPPLYQHASFDNFVVPGPDNPIARRELTNVLLAVKNFVRDFPNENRPGLLFIGEPGTGKTHLAAAALGELIRRYRVRGRFIDFTSLLYQIQSTFDAGTAETKRSVLDPVVSTEVLVIDELGAQKPTAWVSEVLYLILNGRYTRRLPTLFTTNYHLEAAAPSGSPGNPLDRGASPSPQHDLLSSRIPALLVSRLWEMARPVVIESDDYRQHVKSHQHR